MFLGLTEGDGHKGQSAHAGHDLQEAHSLSFCSQAASAVPGARVVLWDLQAACKTSVRSSNRTEASECIARNVLHIGHPGHQLIPCELDPVFQPPDEIQRLCLVSPG